MLDPHRTRSPPQRSPPSPPTDMLPLRLSRASRTTLLTGSLLALIGFPLVLLTLMHADPTGSARPLSLFPTWATRQPLTPTSLVLKGELVGKGLDWKGQHTSGGEGTSHA